MFEKKNVMIELKDPTGMNVELYKNLLREIISQSGGCIKRMTWRSREHEGARDYGVWVFVTVRAMKMYEFRRNFMQFVKFEKRTGFFDGTVIDFEILD